MATRPMMYRSYEEFEREELRPARTRVGFSLDDLIEETTFDSEFELDSVDDDEE